VELAFSEKGYRTEALLGRVPVMEMKRRGRRGAWADLPLPEFKAPAQVTSPIAQLKASLVAEANRSMPQPACITDADNLMSLKRVAVCRGKFEPTTLTIPSIKVSEIKSVSDAVAQGIASLTLDKPSKVKSISCDTNFNHVSEARANFEPKLIETLHQSPPAKKSIGPKISDLIGALNSDHVKITNATEDDNLKSCPCVSSLRDTFETKTTAEPTPSIAQIILYMAMYLLSTMLQYIYTKTSKKTAVKQTNHVTTLRHNFEPASTTVMPKQPAPRRSISSNVAELIASLQMESKLLAKHDSGVDMSQEC
jgi:hypothetical protein